MNNRMNIYIFYWSLMTATESWRQGGFVSRWSRSVITKSHVTWTESSIWMWQHSVWPTLSA